MLVINSIEKTRLQSDSFSYSGSGVAWKARFVLFLGFALLAGGLAGGVVSCFTPGSCLDGWINANGGYGVDGDGSEISGAGISYADAVLWDCECGCKWVGDDELDCVMGFAEYRG